MLTHHGLKPGIVQNELVKSGERNRLSVGDLHDRIGGCRCGVDPPSAR